MCLQYPIDEDLEKEIAEKRKETFSKVCCKELVNEPIFFLQEDAIERYKLRTRMACGATSVTESENCDVVDEEEFHFDENDCFQDYEDDLWGYEITGSDSEENSFEWN